MAPGGKLAGAARHAHVQAAFVGMQHAADGTQLFEGAVLHGRFSRAGNDAHADGTLAFELAVRPSTYLPETFHALRDDVVVGAAQTTVGAEAHEFREHQCRRIAMPGLKIQPQQGDLASGVRGSVMGLSWVT